MKNITKIWVSLVLLAVAGCRAVRNERDTAMVSRNDYVERVVVDSVIVRDSVFVKEKSDTVFYTKYRTLYKERLRVDTIVRCDTVYCEREVFARQETASAFRWSPLPVLLLCGVVLFLLWRTGVLKIIWGLILKCCKLCIRVFRLKE